MKKKLGFIFPAFGMGYKGFKEEEFPEYQKGLDKYLSLASTVVNIDPRLKNTREILEDDVQAHYICYINSCIISDILKQKNIIPEYTAAYSMGLFPALYHTSSVTFEHGLLLSHHASTSARTAVDDSKYGMGVIIGLSYEMVDKLLTKNCKDIEIVDVMNEYVIVISGKYIEIEKLLQIATNKGCLNAKMLPVSLPYHSKFMEKVSTDIEQYLHRISISRPNCKIVSCVDQTLLTSLEDITRELSCNITHHINWLQTMKKMLELGVNVFVECGLSENLCKMAKFIQGDFVVYHPKTFHKLFEFAEEVILIPQEIKITWEVELGTKLQKLLSRVPRKFRDIVQKMISSKAESLAQEENSKVVEAKHVIQAALSESPEPFHPQILQTLAKVGIREIDWDRHLAKKVQKVYKKIPKMFRETIEKVVAAKAEVLAKQRNSKFVEEKDIVEAFLTESPELFHPQIKEMLIQVGININ